MQTASKKYKDTELEIDLKYPMQRKIFRNIKISEIFVKNTALF